MRRFKHSLSHYRLLTCNMGDLIPVTWFEALPGDSIQQATSALIRVSPLLSPVMHPVRVRMHHFFVPNRLLWEDWEDFITGGPDGTSTPTHPYISVGGITEGTLRDYMGLPAVGSITASFNANALPFRAYLKIWNEFYRDQDLVTEESISEASGADSTTDTTTIQKVSWEKDYFTTARPWETKGDAVTIPLTGDAQVIGDGNQFKLARLTDSGTPYGVATTNNTEMVINGGTGNDNLYVPDGTDSGMIADLSSVSGVDINDLRLALALQRYQEARAQYGSRYVEYLRYLGVRSSDARLQNPEYLGGGRQVIQFSEVLSTDGANTGEMKGHGIAAMRTNRYRRFFEEHGIVMTLMSVIPKSIYTEAVERPWLREVKEDYFQRELQMIGEQAITNREAQVNHSTPAGVFGYQGRYDEYRQKYSGTSGEFRSTLDHWHYGRQYSGDISLNSSWVQATPTKRVNASSSTDSLYVMANNSIQARRLLINRAKGKTF